MNVDQRPTNARTGDWKHPTSIAPFLNVQKILISMNVDQDVRTHVMDRNVERQKQDATATKEW